MGFWKQASFGGAEGVRVEPVKLSWFSPGFGSGQDMCEVSGGILLKK